MRIILLGILCLLLANTAHAQKRDSSHQSVDNSGMLLSKIGKSLYDYEVAATTTDSLGRYQWRFILAEIGLRSQVTKEVANDLTSFLFTYNPKTNRYQGEVLRTKKGVNQQQVLAMIYQQLRQNMKQYGKHLDSVRIDKQYFYVLYFPY